MQIILAEEYGFCYGVRRAVAIAEKASELEGVVNTLGSLIHNPQVVAALQEQGIGKIESITDVPENSTLIIRSHGTTPLVHAFATEKKCTLLDATCPNVKKAQLVAQDFQKQGYQVLIIGEKKHPEVQSIASWSEKSIIIEEFSEIASLDRELTYGVLCQTTFEQEKFKEFLNLMEKEKISYLVKPTICLATKRRQDAAIKLAKTVDAMLVIGGLNSANTRHLYEIVKGLVPAWHIEDIAEIVPEMFEEIEVLGITAGASTPNWYIDKIITKIKEFKGL